MPIEKSERSIISIIAEMLKEGETEAGIIKTLRDLGAKDDEARRMLLVAQAQTYEALKNEINKIIESQISKNNPYLREMIKNQVTEIAKRKIFIEGYAEGPVQKKKRGFFSRLIGRLFGKLPREEAAPALPEEASPEAEKLEEVSERITEKPVALKDTLRKLKKKIIKLESLQTQYKGELDYLKQKHRNRTLSPEALERKKELLKKIGSYKTQAEMLERIVSARERLETEMPTVEKERPQIPREELKTMKELSEAARAITMAAQTVVRAAPKPKIVIEDNEEVLSTEQQIEQVKKLQKRLEIDFYKRRISMQDFQTKMLEYQNRLYELEEKKKILEQSGAQGQKEREIKVSKKIEKALEQKLSGRLSEEKLLELENYIFQLVSRKNISEATIEREIKASTPDTMLANLEKLVRISQLQEEAKKVIEDQKQRQGEFPQAIVIQQPQAQGAVSKQGGFPLGETGTAGEQPKERIIVIQAPGPKRRGFFRIGRPAAREKIIVQEEAETEEVEAQPEYGTFQEKRETLRLRHVPGTKYYRAPQEEPKRILVGQEPVFSEAEIPSYPSTIEKKERERIKTIIKEIKKYRIVTDLDLVLEVVKRAGSVGFAVLQKETAIEKRLLQDLLEILEEKELIKVEYPPFGEEKVLSRSYYKKMYKKKYGEEEKNGEDEEIEETIKELPNATVPEAQKASATQSPIKAEPMQQAQTPEQLKTRQGKKKFSFFRKKEQKKAEEKEASGEERIKELESLGKIQELDKIIRAEKKLKEGRQAQKEEN